MTPLSSHYPSESSTIWGNIQPAADIGPGWTSVAVNRAPRAASNTDDNSTAGGTDAVEDVSVYYYSPERRYKFRSRFEVDRFLEALRRLEKEETVGGSSNKSHEIGGLIEGVDVVPPLHHVADKAEKKAWRDINQAVSPTTDGTCTASTCSNAHGDRGGNGSANTNTITADGKKREKTEGDTDTDTDIVMADMASTGTGTDNGKVNGSTDDEEASVMVSSSSNSNNNAPPPQLVTPSTPPRRTNSGGTRSAPVSATKKIVVARTGISSATSSPLAAASRRSRRNIVPVNPSVMPSGAAELGKRPEAIPNPYLPFRKKSKRSTEDDDKVEEKKEWEEKKEEEKAGQGSMRGGELHDDMPMPNITSEGVSSRANDDNAGTDVDRMSIATTETVPDEVTAAPANGDTKTTEPFPVLLHSVISKYARSEGAVSWTGEGDAFTVNDRATFKTDILSSHFGDMSYNAFVRNLIKYGFTTVAAGKRSSTWAHADFRLGYPERSRSIIEREGKAATTSLMADQTSSTGGEPSAADGSGSSSHSTDNPSELTFPQRLHQILSDKANHDAIDWSADGKSFCIVDEAKWKRLLRSTMGFKINSFTRNLYKWGFEHEDSTKPWRHPLFRRNMPRQVSKITEKSKGTPKPREPLTPTSARLQSKGKNTVAMDLGDESTSATDEPSGSAASPATKGSSKAKATADSSGEDIADTSAAQGVAAIVTAGRVSTGKKKARRKHWKAWKASFPMQLYSFLFDSNNSNAIAWTRDGCAFEVVDKDVFCNEFLTQRAGITFSSFVWALSVWGFQSLLDDGKLSWYHPMFQKFRPDLVKEIKVNGTSYGPAGHETNSYGTSAHGFGPDENVSPLVSPSPPQLQTDTTTFPKQLRSLLSNTENHQYIRWNSHGKSFSVIDKLGFEKVLLPYNETALGFSGYKAFEAKLSELGFSLVARDEEFDIWYSSEFQRDSTSDAIARGQVWQEAGEYYPNLLHLATMESGYPLGRVSPPQDDETPPAYPLTFLQKLRAALSDSSNGDVISWNAAGTAFAMQFGNERFRRDILSHLFGAITYEHFADELRMYGFTMISEVPGRSSAWQCDLFVRDIPDVQDAMLAPGMEETSSESYGSSAIAGGSSNDASSNAAYRRAGRMENCNDVTAPRPRARRAHWSGSLIPLPSASSDVDTSMGETSSENSDSDSVVRPSSSTCFRSSTSRGTETCEDTARPRGKRSRPNRNNGSSKKAKITQPKKPAKRPTTKKGRKAAAANSKASSAAPSDSKVAKAIQKVNSEAGGGHKKEATLAAAFMRGITMRPSGKWQAQLYFAGRSRYVGVFDTKEAAMLAHEIMRQELEKYKGKVDVMSAKECNDVVTAARKEANVGARVNN